MRSLVFTLVLSLLLCLVCMPAWANSIYDAGTGLPANEIWQSTNGTTWTQDPITVKLNQTVYFKGTKTTGAALSSHDWDTRYSVNTDQGAGTLKALWDIDWPGSPIYGLFVDYTEDADAVLEHQYTSTGTYSVRMGVDDVYPGTWVDDLSPTPPYTYRLSDNTLSVTVVDAALTLTISPAYVPQDQATTATCTAYLTINGSPAASKTVTFTTTDPGRFKVGETLYTTYGATTDQNGYAAISILSKDFRTGGATATVTATYEVNPDTGGSVSDDEEVIFWDMDLTQPEEGEWLMKGHAGDADEIPLVATASHPSVIEKIAFWVKPSGGEYSLKGEDTSSPYDECSWNTDASDPGAYNIKAIAHDNNTRTLAHSHDIYLYEIDLETRTLGSGDFVAETAEVSPGAYVHFNVDNDNGNTDGSGDPIADYTENGGEDGLENENDTMYMTMTISPLPTSGTVELSRNDTNCKVWSAQTKGVNRGVLVGSNTKTWDLSNQSERDNYISCSDALWAEGVGTTLNCDSTLILKLLNGYEVGQDSVKQTYIAAKCGRQPKPAERVDAENKYPNLKHCEWSITGEIDTDYNCIALSIDETDTWYDDVGDICDHPNDFCCIDYDPNYGNNDGTLTTAEMDTFYSSKKGYTGYDSGPGNSIVMYYSGFHAAIKTSCSCGDDQWIMYESKRGPNVQIEHVWDQLNGSSYGSPIRYYR